MATFAPRKNKNYEIPEGYVGVTEGIVMPGDLNWQPSIGKFTSPDENHFGQEIGNFYAVVRKVEEVESIKIRINKNPKGLSKLAKVAIKK